MLQPRVGQCGCPEGRQYRKATLRPLPWECLGRITLLLRTAAPGREHEIAYGKIPLHRWIFIFQDNQPIQDRYLVTNSGGFLTFPIFTHIIDVADGLYSKLYSIGSEVPIK